MASKEKKPSEAELREAAKLAAAKVSKLEKDLAEALMENEEANNNLASFLNDKAAKNHAIAENAMQEAMKFSGETAPAENSVSGETAPKKAEDEQEQTTALINFLQTLVTGKGE